MARAFGNLKESLYQSEYLNKKKNNAQCCGKYKSNTNINTKQLINSQYTNMDLENSCPAIYTNDTANSTTCADGITISIDPITGAIIAPNPNVPFYSQIIIDPKGDLFGNTPCGVLNYTEFMIPIDPSGAAPV